jgi:hypothetical protein
MPVFLADLCVTGREPLVQERPSVSKTSDGIILESPSAHQGTPRLKCCLGTRLDIAIGAVFRRQRPDRHEDSMFARPSDATALLNRQLDVMHEVLRRLDPRNVIQRCVFQVSLSNLGMSNFAEPPESTGRGIPVNMDGDRVVFAYEKPTAILANDMRKGSDLSARIIARILRATSSGRR